MNKTELTERLAVAAGINKAQAQKALQAVQDLIQESLCAGEPVDLKGFGKFEPKTMSAREGRNPKTGEPITVPERKSMKFAPSKLLVKAIADA